MSALSTILSPVSPLENRELIPLKRENGDEEAPMAKRRRSTPPSLSPLGVGVREEGGSKDGIGGNGVGIGGRNEGLGRKDKKKDREERKAKWLTGLTHRELLGVALGAVWSCMSLSHSPLPPSLPSSSPLLIPFSFSYNLMV